MAHRVECLLTWCSLFHVHVWPCARPPACSVYQFTLCVSHCVLWLFDVCPCVHTFHSISHFSITKNALYIRVQIGPWNQPAVGAVTAFLVHPSSLLLHGNIHYQTACYCIAGSWNVIWNYARPEYENMEMTSSLFVSVVISTLWYLPCCKYMWVVHAKHRWIIPYWTDIALFNWRN